MSIFKECPLCGANLDPGEARDCREPKLVTYADWEAAGSFTEIAKPGDAVEERVVDEFLNCLPPVRRSVASSSVGSRTAMSMTRRRDTGGHLRHLPEAGRHLALLRQLLRWEVYRPKKAQIRGAVRCTDTMLPTK